MGHCLGFQLDGILSMLLASMSQDYYLYLYIYCVFLSADMQTLIVHLGYNNKFYILLVRCLFYLVQKTEWTTKNISSVVQC